MLYRLLSLTLTLSLASVSGLTIRGKQTVGHPAAPRVRRLKPLQASVQNSLQALTVDELLNERARRIVALEEIDKAIDAASGAQAGEAPRGDAYEEEEECGINPKFQVIDYNYGFITKSRGVFGLGQPPLVTRGLPARC